ncbi:MAG TPA: GNAT family N-acetyltransferase [Syntrophales bacterium]|nr:GNAT family N-acetyltransferase [Syntrophales bacterium]HOM07723.1 GNAT family N-acetyltransferase [Syntrophales bacterium]HOO00386.1 GNAT family N-acetyltransferase [Syntrophales bacterium]HPC01733.1 GNAT family N-acetyltransferase [Syntrophales bacterium]HPQ07246.1 GNAT family N-acetyltransferase [Syntrophales bacterium]
MKSPVEKVRVERYLRATVLNDVVELEKRVWRREGYREVNAPMLYFELAYLTNGLVLTAFDEGLYTPSEKASMAREDPWYEGDRPIAFAALFADFDDHGPFWYGARMGVDERYRDKNVGEALLAHIYDCAKERRIPRIRWTYDPLQSRNGYIYLRRLGGLVREIGFNYYSAVFTNDHFNRGISTDRFVVEWYINSARVRERMEEGRIPPFDARDLKEDRKVNEIVIEADGLEGPGDKSLFNRDDTPLFVEIPYAQDLLLKTDRQRAQALRDRCRALFMHYLARGYIVTDFVLHKEEGGRRRAFYRLDRDKAWRDLVC